ncbi:group II intron reverse transcriptase/maturase, partial [Priestia megaterium]
MHTSLRASAHVSHKDWYSIDRLLLRSKANLLLSIRRVTHQNNGNRTPGVYGYTASKPNDLIKLYQQLGKCNVFRHRPKPAQRTFIPMKNGKLRPLGIHTMRDRVYQNVVKN